MNFFWRKTKPSRSPETITPPQIDFVGEQAGPVEDSLKEKFRKILAEAPTVRSAYLARLSYGESPGYSVGLCIRSAGGTDMGLQKRLGQAFTEVFHPDQYLDILFLRDDQEQKLRKVCSPFYEAAS